MLLRIHSISSFLRNVFWRITLLGLCYRPYRITYTVFDWIKIVVEGLGSFMDDLVDIYFTVVSVTGIPFSLGKRDIGTRVIMKPNFSLVHNKK